METSRSTNLPMTIRLTPVKLKLWTCPQHASLDNFIRLLFYMFDRVIVRLFSVDTLHRVLGTRRFRVDAKGLSVVSGLRRVLWLTGTINYINRRYRIVIHTASWRREPRVLPFVNHVSNRQKSTRGNTFQRPRSLIVHETKGANSDETAHVSSAPWTQHQHQLCGLPLESQIWQGSHSRKPDTYVKHTCNCLTACQVPLRPTRPTQHSMSCCLQA
jgi:hypothetical protein